MLRDGVIETDVTYVDSFGNLRLAGGATSLADAFGSDADDTLSWRSPSASTP